MDDTEKELNMKERSIRRKANRALNLPELWRRLPASTGAARTRRPTSGKHTLYKTVSQQRTKETEDLVVMIILCKDKARML